MSPSWRSAPTGIDVALGSARLIARQVTRRVTRTGGSGSARYCYSVWLRHLVKAAEAGLPTEPRSIVELGPGDSIGVGLAALLTGAEEYFALDQVAFARNQSNIMVFDGLVELLHQRSPIPDNLEFPEIRPRLADYSFPAEVLSDTRLAAALDPFRVARLRRAITETDGSIRYVAPWDDSSVLPAASADLIISQAVLEHVVNVDATYLAMARWLRPGGYLSHQIDFRSHHTSMTLERALGLLRTSMGPRGWPPSDDQSATAVGPPCSARARRLPHSDRVLIDRDPEVSIANDSTRDGRG